MMRKNPNHTITIQYDAKKQAECTKEYIDTINGLKDFLDIKETISFATLNRKFGKMTVADYNQYAANIMKFVPSIDNLVQVWKFGLPVTVVDFQYYKDEYDKIAANRLTQSQYDFAIKTLAKDLSAAIGVCADANLQIARQNGIDIGVEEKPRDK